MKKMTKKINNIILLVIILVIILFWYYDCTFTTRPDWSETIFKIGILFSILLLTLNNLIDR